MFSQIPRQLAVLLINLAAALLVSACGGSGSSSSGQEPEPPAAAPSDLLVYRQDSSSQLYKLDSMGGSTLVSEGALASDYVISPDGKYIAFGDRLADGQTALAIRRLAGNTRELPSPLYAGGASLSVHWRPDSQALVYSVFDASAFVSYLYLATLGEPDPVELIGSNLGTGARLYVAQSSDASRLAVLVEYYAFGSEPIPDSAALYLLEPANPGTITLLGTAEGDANSFRFAWSPYADELVYQRRLRTGPLAPSVPDNYPAGPLMLMEGSGMSRVLREAEGVRDWTELTWLEPTRILLVTADLEIIDTAGNLVTRHTLVGNRRIAVAPGQRRLAFIDRDLADGHPAVYMLALDSGEYRELGPASSDFLTGGAFEDSSLRWSSDGSYLAWNVKPSPFGPDWEDQVAELYLYDVAGARTQRVGADLALHNQHYLADGLFSWLPGGTAIDYVARRASGYELTVLDIASGNASVVGEFTELSCSVQRAWRDPAEVLWNVCGEGVYLSKTRQSGTFTSSRIADTNVWRMVATVNRDFSVMQPADGVNALLGVPWQVYDFSRATLKELDGTGSTFCCGTVLQ